MKLATRMYKARVLLAAAIVASLFLITPLASAATPNVPCKPLLKSSSIVMFPTWYEYLSSGRTDSLGRCTVPDAKITDPAAGVDFNGIGILLIVLAFIDIFLRIAGLVALGFIIYAGVRYTMSVGSPDKVQQAQGTLRDAIIGLVIAIVAVGIVSFLGHTIG